MPKSKIHLPLETDHYTAIGRVTARAAALDLVLDIVIWTLLRVPEHVGRAVTAHRSASDRINLAKTLIDLLVNEEDDKRIDNIMAEAKRCNDDRNDLIHALWTYGSDDLVRGEKYTARGKLKRHHKDWTLDAINDVATRLETVAGDLLDFLRILDSSDDPLDLERDLPSLSKHDLPD